MNVYSLDDERTIRTGRLARDWMKSGLLSEAQYERIKPKLQVDLRRTNPFLRLTLFVFTMLILQSALGLVGIVILAPLFANGPGLAAALCVAGAVVCFWLAGFLVERYRLYHFGIEEAVAVSAVLLLAGGVALGWSEVVHVSDSSTIIVALLAGAAVAAAVFVRFGYVYAALAAMACCAGVPFLLGDPLIFERMLSIGILAAIAAAAWMKRREYGDEHPGDSYGFIEAVAWIGIYVVLTLDMFGGITRTTWWYWPNYAAMWIVPLLGLWLAIRSRHRMLLDVSVVMLLVTLMLNKEYLGSPRHSWDAIVFGLMLMGGAIALKRWLASGDHGERDGFTATRILASDKSRASVLGTIASLAHPGTPAAQPAAAADPIGGGGRSGGAGATGSF